MSFNWDYVCMAICLLHAVVSWVVAIKQNKKIKAICNKCAAPILEGEQHMCLTDPQMLALVAFVDSLKKDGDVDVTR